MSAIKRTFEMNGPFQTNSQAWVYAWEIVLHSLNGTYQMRLTGTAQATMGRASIKLVEVGACNFGFSYPSFMGGLTIDHIWVHDFKPDQGSPLMFKVKAEKIGILRVEPTLYIHKLKLEAIKLESVGSHKGVVYKVAEPEPEPVNQSEDDAPRNILL